MLYLTIILIIYKDQFKAPWFHSWYSPNNKILIKNINDEKYRVIDEIFIIKIKGIKSVISTSKIKKITAIKKNCKEKGIRAELLGSNPHSKGLAFSRSINVFLEIILAKIIIIEEIIKKIDAINVMANIIYTKFI